MAEKIEQLKTVGIKVGAGSSCTICILFLSKIDQILMDFVLCISESAKHSKSIGCVQFQLYVLMCMICAAILVPCKSLYPDYC